MQFLKLNILSFLTFTTSDGIQYFKYWKFFKCSNGNPQATMHRYSSLSIPHSHNCFFGLPNQLVLLLVNQILIVDSTFPCSEILFQFRNFYID